MKERQPSQTEDLIDRLRLLSHADGGKGDYTTERVQLFQGETVESIIAAIKARRPKDVVCGKMAY